MGSPEKHTAEIEEESDKDLATESDVPEEPEEKAEESEPEEEVEEHPEVTKEDLEKEIAELQEKARLQQEKFEYWRDANRQARAAHFQGREVESPPTEVGAPEVPTEKAPVEDDFEDYNEYIDALTDWKVEQKLAEYDQRAQLRHQNEAHAEKRVSLVEKLELGREKYADFDEIVHDPIVPITEQIVDILAESEYPAEIAYYLGKNLSVATKISRMPPLAAARAIGKIEAKIAEDEEGSPGSGSPSPQPKPTATKKTTSAPEPIKPVRPGGAEVVSKDPSKMTNEEYRKWRMGQMKKK
jgi:hypothetical protein